MYETSYSRTCVAVSPSNFKLCALRDRDNDGPNFVEFLSNSIAAARLRSSTIIILFDLLFLLINNQLSKQINMTKNNKNS